MVLCILVSIPDLTVYSVSLSTLCMISSCGFVAGLCYNKRMAWERFARLSSFVLLPVEEIAHCFASLSSVFGFVSQHGSVCLAHPSKSNNLCRFINSWSLILHVLKCEFLLFLSAGLAHWHPTNPHTIIMAAGFRRGHPQLCPPVKCR